MKGGIDMRERMKEKQTVFIIIAVSVVCLLLAAALWMNAQSRNANNPVLDEPIPTEAPVYVAEEDEEEADEAEEYLQDEPGPAYDIGAQAGEFFNQSIDFAADFWQGFDEATGASEWASERWAEGRERFREWTEGRGEEEDEAE